MVVTQEFCDAIERERTDKLKRLQHWMDVEGPFPVSDVANGLPRKNE
jgi:hypothetical protein